MTFALKGGGIARAAEISPCGQFRYRLSRIWDEGAHLLPIIMLNPSTADASIDDPTIRRCMAFARREGLGGIEVANLFAFRTSSPAAMKGAADPIGPDNNRRLGDLFEASAGYGVPVLAAWGVHGDHLERAREVVGWAKHHGAALVCLGITREGHPRHPLYVSGDQPLEPFGGGNGRR
ncbi:DUF1643 domain-containing protein [Sphingomonas leidyi]|uniref:DUF1643 domain-containing protein n=1 Tax=Sphingomonas leidyi TaxID=68569 RepID=UPI0036D2D3A7